MGLSPIDIKSAFAFVEGLKKARDIAKTMDNLELKQLLVDAIDEAANAKLLVVGYKEENAELREKLSAAEKRSELEENLTIKGSVYVWKDKPQTGSDGPFCAPCFEVGKTLVTLKAFNQNSHGREYKCPHCEKYAEDYDKAAIPPPPRRKRGDSW